MNVRAFQDIVWEQGRLLYRDMPWRQDTSPYAILVSELMLQQTQVDRVVPKFLSFIEEFPTVGHLASAPLGDVLRLWSGLGYNRRAKYLHEAAKKIIAEFNSVVPKERSELESLPGVGKNTAGAVRAYAYGLPEVFIETNIRTVYFYHFYDGVQAVSDKELAELVALTLDQEHPREWYWALMDYGSFLKRQGAGMLTVSSHYKKQSPLAGSLRETRGAVLRELSRAPFEREALRLQVDMDDRFTRAVDSLLEEGLVIQEDTTLRLP